MTNGPDNLQEQILSHPGGLTILRGCAGAGKTHALLELYRRVSRERGAGSCLLIAPNSAAVEHLRRRLLEGEPGRILIGPQVMTFASAAARILAWERTPSRMIPPSFRYVLLRRIVAELAGAGKLSALQSVAEMPGLPASLDRAIAELKRAAVEPDDLARAAAAEKDRGKSQDLLAVYRRYQQHLQQRHLYDVEGQMWAARDELARMTADESLWRQSELSQLAVIGVDGFTDFTPTQLEILSLLARRMQAVAVTLPLADDARERLWRWSRRTQTRMAAALGERLHEIVVERSSGGELPALVEGLFGPTSGLRDAAAAKGHFSVISAAGVDSEVAAVARRVKRLLVEGAGAGRIAVLARSMEIYRPAIDRIFEKHRIPIASAGVPLTAAPPVRLLMQVASLGPDFEYAPVLAAVKNSYFRPQALGDFSDDTVAAAERIIREGNVLSGRESYRQVARRLAAKDKLRQEAPLPDENGEMVIGLADPQLEKAADMLDKLFELASQAIDAEGLLRLAQSLQLAQAAKRQRVGAFQLAADFRALGCLEETLRQLTAEAAEAGVSPPSAQEVRASLAEVTVRPARRESLVDVLDVLDARAMRYDHVFLLGLSEGQFPRRFTESSLIGEGQRRRWSGRGVALDCQGDLVTREMLLMYLALSRADRTLTVSYLSADSMGKPQSPSHFLLALLDVLGGLEACRRGGLITAVDAGQFLPPASEIASESDAFCAAVAGFFQADPAVAPSSPGWVAKGSVLLDRAAAGLLCRYRRWRPQECDEYDGRIGDLSLLERLRERFPKKEIFSASQFNTYAQCPWAFFGRYVLNLQEPPQPRRMLDAADVGAFCHNVLFEVMTLLRGGRASVRLADVDERVLRETLARALEQESAAIEKRWPAYPVLWCLQRTQLGGQLEEYLLAQRAKEDLSSESLFFELAFGLAGVEVDHSDAAGQSPAVCLRTPPHEISVRGKIDRIDRVEFEGQRGLLVVDYKTGKASTQSAIEAGEDFQLPLYAAAIEKIFSDDGPVLGGVFHEIIRGGENYFAAFRHQRKTLKEWPEYRRKFDELMGRLGEMVEAMREGRFDALPVHECPCYCIFRQICHFSPARVELKTAPQGGQP